MISKKVLFVATVSKHIIRFHLPYLKWFRDNGYETHVAANGEDEIPYCDFKHLIPIERSPYSFKNIKAYFILKRIINTNKYSLIHAHTPMGGVLARLAARKARKKGCTVLYTAHGFHFYKGAPLLNWLLYYPVEKYLAKYTDCIITINSEDYEIVKRKHFKVKNFYKINGVGVNNERFKKPSDAVKQKLRIKHNYNANEFIIIYVAEFIKRKNHIFILKAIPHLAEKIPDLKVIFAGRGRLLNAMQKYSRKHKLSSYVQFTGFRTDIEELISLADIGVSASKQEGLGLNLVEEMFCGLPVVASENRGHKEIVIHGFNGFLFPQNDIQLFSDYLYSLYINVDLRKKLGENAILSTTKFSDNYSLKTMTGIYKYFIQGIITDK